MRRLDEILSDLAGSGDVGGPERMVQRLERRLSAGDDVVFLGETFDADPRRTAMQDHKKPRSRLLLVAAATAAALVVGVPALLLFGDGDTPTEEASKSTIPSSTAPTSVATPVATSPPTAVAEPASPIEWDRVPVSDGVFGHSFVVSVSEYRGRLIAVGYTQENDQELGYNTVEETWASDSAMWISDDGATWTRLDVPGLATPNDKQMLYEVAAGSNEVVAIGTSGRQGTLTLPDGVVWRSDDGIEWELVASGREFGLMDDVVWTGTRWIAVGGHPSDGARVWTSVDGTVWTPIPATDIEGSTAQGMMDVVVTDWGLVAAGSSAMWVSADGDSWELVESSLFGTDETLFAVTVSPGGNLVAFGDAVYESDSPLQPDSWRVVEESHCADWGDNVAWHGEIGLSVGFLSCSTTDAGGTWLQLDANDPFCNGCFVRDILVFDDRWIAVGAEPAIRLWNENNGTPLFTGELSIGAVWVGIDE